MDTRLNSYALLCKSTTSKDIPGKEKIDDFLERFDDSPHSFSDEQQHTGEGEDRRLPLSIRRAAAYRGRRRSTTSSEQFDDSPHSFALEMRKSTYPLHGRNEELCWSKGRLPPNASKERKSVTR
ncbi:hypothetical protein Scep_001362 [Stephania cephalantha]|uniref:Uncharacterized protein n=1 Tax=Stephania cephalantha TaxID=152367 RepID=A0AAP0L887_9MAGN